MNAARCSGPLNRREFLRIGSLALGGLALSDVLAARAAAGTVNSDTSTIFLYLHGGPSQLETYDLKPQAPIEYRSVFHPIPTNVSGIHIGDHLPKIAQIMDRLTVVRSLTHPYPLHGTVYATTGIPDVDTRIESQRRHGARPCRGAYRQTRRRCGRESGVTQRCACDRVLFAGHRP